MKCLIELKKNKGKNSMYITKLRKKLKILRLKIVTTKFSRKQLLMWDNNQSKKFRTSSKIKFLWKTKKNPS